MSILRTIIIDDEPNQRENIRLILEKHCTNIKIIAEGKSALEGAALVAKLDPDVVFLDIEMPGGTGLDLLKSYEDMDAQVVLVTAHENYMHDAFKVNVFDYLVKPIDIDEMIETVKRLHASARKEATQTRKIGLPSSNGLVYIEKEKIVFVGAQGSYSEVHFSSGEKMLISKNLKYFESILDEKTFMRIHRSSIANISHVKEFSRSEGGIVILSGGHEIQVSADRRDRLLEKLAEQ